MLLLPSTITAVNKGVQIVVYWVTYKQAIEMRRCISFVSGKKRKVLRRSRKKA